MLSAVDTFMAIANATAAIYEKCPPFATYHVHTVVRYLGERGVVDKNVAIRMADDGAVDQGRALDAIERPFPAPPNFDALSDYAIRGSFDATRGSFAKREPAFRIENLELLRYHDIPSHADAIARSIRGYVVSFAADSTEERGHLVFKSVTPPQHEARPHLTDVYYSPSTLLPTRVIATAIITGGTIDKENHILLDASYQTIGNAWVL